MEDIDDVIQPVQYLIDALNFYSNPDNYWSEPLSLDKNYCRSTLKDVREAEKLNKVLQDRGKIAWDAICKFDEFLRTQKELNDL